MLMSQAAARRYNLRPLAYLRSFAVVGRRLLTTGCPPDIMGIGPALAIPKALEKAGLKVADIDLFELNEAFASQAVYCIETLGLPMDRVNGG
jgi:acetyl-CoA acetyltransferase